MAINFRLGKISTVPYAAKPLIKFCRQVISPIFVPCSIRHISIIIISYPSGRPMLYAYLIVSQGLPMVSPIFLRSIEDYEQ